MSRIVVFTLFSGLIGCSNKTLDTISLAGEWHVKLDSLDVGEQEKWAMELMNPTSIELPGTLDDAGLGKQRTLEPALNNMVLSSLNRKIEYYGKAWYQKEVNIPEDWKNREIRLVLERVLWESKVYVDGTPVASRKSLVGTHEYELSEMLTPGIHLISVRIDNSDQYPLINVIGNRYPEDADKQMAHAYTNHTQIKWNGILGTIALQAYEKSTPENLQLYPDLENNSIEVFFEQPGSKIENIQFEISDSAGNTLFSEEIDKPIIENSVASFSVPRPPDLKIWDEFSPNLYTAVLTSGGQSVTASFGFREISANNNQLHLNGQRVYFRGNLECVIFPLTGYPPMNKKEWAALFDQARNYGLNHLRFHSWCPPKAAFEAADEAGIYLQVELPHWSVRVGEDRATTEFLYAEAHKMIRDYGNHPSFVMMSMGNELEGSMKLLNEMTKSLKSQDSRRLYATTSFSFQEPSGTRPEIEDEFFITQWTDKGWIRGQGIFNDVAPGFDEDYSKNMKHIEVPVISHEIGQYSVYPDLSEIPKYIGVLEPLNFIAVKNDLEKKALLHLAEEFTLASGKLAAMLYKEEIERALKTEEFDGFQLLQLQDFPGQGTALVGLLNAFWESKGVISGEEFRKFNAEVVPLLRFEKAVYKTGETFQATIEVANFYKKFSDQKISWTVSNEKGELLGSEHVSTPLTIGNNKDLYTLSFPLHSVKAEKLYVSVKLDGTKYENSWPIWVYPDIDINTSHDIVVTSSFEEAKTALKKGRHVLLNPMLEEIDGITGRFVPVFWSPVHFPDQPGTMGLLIDEKHPALSDFPTSGHTEWNWWDLCIKSKSVVLDDTGWKPIVRVIDNFVTNHSLGNLMEAKVGEGSLVFTSIDLSNDMDNRTVAKQLKHSLLEYMKSEEFDPKNQIEWQEIEKFQVK